MNVSLAVLCDAANVSVEGKLNIFGIFGQICARTFPAVQPRMYLVSRVECSSAEYGVARTIKVLLMDQDGREICRVEGDIIPPPSPGPRSEVNLIFPFENLAFPAPSDYSFHILIGDDQKGSVPLILTHMA